MECSRYGQFKGSGGTLSTNVGFKQDRSHQLNAAHELREAIVEYRQATEWSLDLIIIRTVILKQLSTKGTKFMNFRAYPNKLSIQADLFPGNVTAWDR